MRSSISNTTQPVSVHPRWRVLFEDRYGVNGLSRLLDVFAQPCVTFAAIADEYGVTRERVRQWHMQLLPDEPRGHDRQRLCKLSRQKRQLFQDPLFRSFYRSARRHFPPGHLSLVRSRAGFRKSIVRLSGKVVLVRQAGPAIDQPLHYTLRIGQVSCDFVYYRLSNEDFLFVPRRVLPAGETNFIDNGRSKYRSFKNSFDTALAPPRGEGLEDAPGVERAS